MRRVKTIYCLAVIAVAIVLSCTGGLVGWIAAIIVLAGALPMFRAVNWTASNQGADEAIANLRHRWYAHHATPDEESASVVHRSANRR
jgi:hypothetical protein